MDIIPCNENILVKIMKIRTEENKTSSGIITSNEPKVNNQSRLAEIIKVGEAVESYQIGQTLVIKKNLSDFVKIAGRNLHIIQTDDIIATLDLTQEDKENFGYTEKEVYEED